MPIKRQNIPLNALRVFETVARQQNMTQAAEALNVTHSAVSQHIRKLEDLLQTRLFDRSHKPLRLTPKGDRLLASVIRGMDVLAEATDEVQRGGISGVLKVSCVPGLGANWFINILGEFLASHENLRLHMSTYDWHMPARTDDVDLALAYGSAEHPGKRVTRLGHPQFFPVCSPRITDGRPTPVAAEKIRKLALLHERTDETWSRWFTAAGMDAGTSGRDMFFDSAHLSLQAARAGLGVALADMPTVRRNLHEGRLIRLTDIEIPAIHPYYIVTPPHDRLNPAALALETWVLEQYRRLDTPPAPR